MTNGKLLGVVDVPPKATHVQVHGVTETGAIGPCLKIEVEEGRWADLFPVGEVSRAWLTSYISAGVYRFAFWSVDSKGTKIRMGRTSGSVQVDEEPAVPAKKKRPAGEAPSSGGGLDAIALFTLMREMQATADKSAREFYAMQTERDRQFYATLMAGARGAAPAAEEPEDPDDGDEEEETDVAGAVIRVLKAMGEEARPLLEKLAKDKVITTTGEAAT